MMKWFLPAALLALSGCGKSDNLDGFKDISFGLSKEKVEALGFACVADGQCEADRQRSDQSVAAYAPAPIGSGDAARGERVFAKCSACHTIDQGGANGIGPNLYGIVGTPVAQGRGGFAFSDALKAKGGSWNFAALDSWLFGPARQAPGTKMTFAGISDPQDRADVIVYLNAQGSNLPLPAIEAGTTPLPSRSEIPKYTLFGLEARVVPTLKGGKVESVDVTISLKDDDVVELFRKEYGDPQGFEFTNALSARISVRYWLFANGTSISIRKIVDGGPFGSRSMLRREGLGSIADLPSPTNVRYLDESATSLLLRQAKGNSVDPNDT